MLATLLLGTGGEVHAADPRARDVVVVFDIDAKATSYLNAEKLADFNELLDAVVAQAGYQTSPRDGIRAELRRQQEDSFRACYDDACQIEVGKALSAQKALLSDWVRIAGTCMLMGKLYDLRTEVAEFQTKVEVACSEEGLKAAIESVGGALRSHRQEGVGAFEIELAEAKGIKNPPTDKRGYLVVVAVARGAHDEPIQIYINGRLAGSTRSGQVFQKELDIGQYTVHLRTAGGLYATRRFDFQMTTSRIRIPEDGLLELLPMFGDLVLQGSPSNARLIVGDELRTITSPHREKLRAGKHVIRIEAPGYLPGAAREVEIGPGETKVLDYHLPKDVGSLKVAGRPAGADVRLNGEHAGTVPLRVDDLGTGTYTVEVSKPGHHRERHTVNVRLDSTTELEVNLRPKVGRLKAEAFARVMDRDAAVEADVVLDGALVGTTPWKREVLADVPLRITLRLGEAVTEERVVQVAEGTEHAERIEVPPSWAGATAGLRLDLVEGPWEVRSGDVVLDAQEEHALPPGRTNVDLLLDGERLHTATLTLSPGEHRTLVVAQRPRSKAEMERATSAWTWRRWVSTGLALGAAALGGERIVASHRATNARDAALDELPAATTAEDLDALRQSVIDHETDRDMAQTMGLAAVGAASALAVWSLIEWIWGEPQRGRLVTDETGVGRLDVRGAK